MPAAARSRSSSSWFKDFAAHLRARHGWQRYGLAFAYGALCALAFPPADAVPVLWVGFPALLFLLQGTEDARRAFATGWFFAFGFFTFDLYWTAAAMFVDLRHFWWAVPLAGLGLPAALALFYGTAAALARRIGLQGLAGILTFALLWFLADYVRGHVFTGFPWNIEGYAWTDFLPVLQATSIIGIYGLTLLTLVAACLPALLADDRSHGQGRALFMGTLILFGLVAIWGSTRLMEAPVSAVPHIRLRIVQPDVKQEMKWREDERDQNFNRLIKLSAAPGDKPVTMIVWPETAAPFYLAEDAAHRRQAAAILPPGGALITGVLRAEIERGGQEIRYYNSLIAIDHDAKLTGVYDKFHLVPFGEYMPFRQWIPAAALAGMGLDFSHGPGPQTLRVPGVPPFSPLICYEAIFPGEVANRGDRPQFLLNVTNDGWYGNTAGPYQHFAIARVRAVEEGMPLVRAANTGISGIVDAFGRIETKLDLGSRGFIDGDLPQTLPAPSFFSQHGESILWLIFTVLAAGAFFGRVLAKKLRD